MLHDSSCATDSQAVQPQGPHRDVRARGMPTHIRGDLRVVDKRDAQDLRGTLRNGSAHHDFR
jgi:hypothetical protein